MTLFANVCIKDKNDKTICEAQVPIDKDGYLWNIRINNIKAIKNDNYMEIKIDLKTKEVEHG